MVRSDEYLVAIRVRHEDLGVSPGHGFNGVDVVAVLREEGARRGDVHGAPSPFDALALVGRQKRGHKHAVLMSGAVGVADDVLDDGLKLMS